MKGAVSLRSCSDVPGMCTAHPRGWPHAFGEPLLAMVSMVGWRGS